MGELVQTTTRWEWRGAYPERLIPKAAGCRWDPAARVWWTTDEAVVQRLRPFVGESLESLQTAQRVEAASRATDAQVDVPLPDGLELLPYQRAGVAWLLDHAEGCLLGDEMGLGKTVQAIAAANVIAPRRVLVIAPLSLAINWEREWRKWSTLGLTVGRASTREVPDAQVVIIHPEGLVAQEKTLAARTWDLVVLDEAHLFKNRKTKRFASLAAIPATRRWALTGTPALNTPDDMWAVLHWIQPTLWGSWSSFAKRYAGLTYNGWAWVSSGVTNGEELNQRLRLTTMVRRLKTDVLTELPAKRRTLVILDAQSPHLRRAVEAEQAVLAKATAELGTDVISGAWDQLAHLMARSPAVFEELSRVRHDTALAKVPDVIERATALLNETPKIIVWAHHLDVVDALCDGLRSFGVVRVVGADSPAERDAAVQAFQHDPDVRVFVGGLRAASVGLTLTAASVVLFCELDWVPATVTQAEDRAHRIGQDRMVLIEHLVVDGTIDARMAELLVEKSRMADHILDRVVGWEQPTTKPATKLAEPATKLADTPELPAGVIKPELPAEVIEKVRQALRELAAMDSDHASRRNDQGFSRLDGPFGHSLAEASQWTPKQAWAAARLARRYRRQIGHLLPSELDSLLSKKKETA